MKLSTLALAIVFLAVDFAAALLYERNQLKEMVFFAAPVSNMLAFVAVRRGWSAATFLAVGGVTTAVYLLCELINPARTEAAFVTLFEAAGWHGAVDLIDDSIRWIGVDDRAREIIFGWVQAALAALIISTLILIPAVLTQMLRRRGPKGGS